jgi:hypothetical protein
MQSTMTTLDAATEGFVRAMLWADAIPLDMGPNGQTGGLEDHEATPELQAKARELCAAFLQEARPEDVEAFMDAYGDPDGGHPGEYVGHTFYLNAAGHGVSFTDRAWREADPMTRVCERLADAANVPEVEHLCAFEQPDGTVGL